MKRTRPPTEAALYRNNAVGKNLAIWRLPMPRYYFDVSNGHTLFDAAGFVCDDDTDAMTQATVLAIGVSLYKPGEAERRIAIVDDKGREIGNVPVCTKPSYDNPGPIRYSRARN
jgi:hypothetical protein